MQPLIISLSDKVNAQNREIGGKAQSLVRLISEGFNVPQGFAITAQLQQMFFDRNGIPNLIKIETENLKSDDFAKCSSAAKRIRDAIIDAELSQEELDTISKTVQELGKGQTDIRFAVRSSGGFEDGQTDSWAGQFDSFLDIRPEDTADYTKRCWASMFGTRAINYGSAFLLGEITPSFSVIVQHMVHGEYSGIAFSVDPADGDSSHVRVEAVSGTGEKAVGGQEIPYSVVLSKEDGLIVRRSFGSQGRVELIKPSILKELMNEVVKIESVFEMPVDVEWTIKDSVITILQARPITSKNGSRTKRLDDLLPDILDYELTFKVAGLGFMFADLLCRGFGYLHPLFICNDGNFLQYFTKERMEYAAKYGYRWLSRPDGFEQYRNEFVNFHEGSFPELKSIIEKDLTPEGIQQFFLLVYQYFIFYSKMDFQFTNLTFLYISENQIIAENLRSLSAFKDVARVWINAVSIDDDCLLNQLLSKITEKFGVSNDALQYYKISEMSELFDNKMVSEDELSARSNSSIALNDGQTIRYAWGDKAANYVGHVKEIQRSQASAEIVGQVANGGTERYITGIVRLINVDYSNLDNMEFAMAEMKLGEILISEFTAPELMAACSKAKAIVTDLGGMLSHAAIVSRELGIPCVVGTEHASRSLKNGEKVRIDLDLGIVERI